VFCRLEALVDTIVAEAGGKKVANFEFTYRGENLSLQWKGDMKPLVENHGELSNYMMEWIRAWLNPQIEGVKCHVCSPYLCPLLFAHIEEHREEGIEVGLEVYVAFIHDKYGGSLPPQDIKTLIVPYTDGKHWTAYMMGEHGFYHLDSLVVSKLHADVTIRKRLAKLWAAWSGHDTDADTWRAVSSSHQWIQATVPQQNSGWACGFYMLKNIMEYTKTLRDRPHTLCEVNKS
jgi:hypothetical protein